MDLSGKTKGIQWWCTVIPGPDVRKKRYIPDVFETGTSTGSKLFSLLTCVHQTTFKLLSIFFALEMISLKIWDRLHCST